MTGDIVRVAAIDCGTNSLRLLIADRTDGGLREISRTMRIVRLGQDIDRTRRLAPAALDRAAAVLAEYRAAIDSADVTAVRMVATSAVRDAVNRPDFDAMVMRVLGHPAEVVTGRQEAQLSFAGVCAGLSSVRDGRVLVADIGGGSTELVSGNATRGRAEVAVSLDVGSVRMTERHIRHDPPTAAEVSAIEADVHAALDTAAGEAVAPGTAAAAGNRDELRLRPGDHLVGVAGTVTTVAALALGLDRYDSAVVHGAALSRGEIDAAVISLLSMDHDQRAARAVIHPGRVDVIAAGAIILRALMNHLAAERLTVSEHDILDGIALGVQA